MSLMQFFGEHEQLSVGIITALFILFSASMIIDYYGFFSPHYDSIFVNYTKSGNSLVVHEIMSIAPSGASKQVVYRSFSDRACLSSSCSIHILSVGCKVGRPYFSGYDGNPVNPAGGARYVISRQLKQKIRANEVGCFLNSSTYANVSEETLSITYEVPMSYVAEHNYMHCLFSEDHLPIYKLIAIGLEGRSSKRFVPGDVHIFIDVSSGKIKSGGVPLIAGLILVALISATPLVIWHFFGREKNFLVPEYLHALPDPEMEPWKVDVLTNGMFKLSKNGLASIILKLYVDGVLKFGEKNDTKDVLLINKHAPIGNLSDKEKQVYDLIKSGKFKEDDDYIYCSARRVNQQKIMKVVNGPGIKSFIGKIIDARGFYFILVSAMVLMFILGFLGLVSVIGIFSITLIFFLLVFMATVFSRFKGDYYKRYLEWLSFKRMLTDFAQIKKYFKEDYRQWRSWLIYATALGAAENVIKAMKELKFLSKEDVDSISSAYVSSGILANSIYPSSNSSSGAGGVSGGFGGGGGGMR